MRRGRSETIKGETKPVERAGSIVTLVRQMNAKTESKYNQRLDLVKSSFAGNAAARSSLASFLPNAKFHMNTLNSIKEFRTEQIVPAIVLERTFESFSIDEYLNITRIEDYIIGMQVGRGASSVVRLATHKPDNRQVAMKTYEKLLILDPKRKKNITREMYLLKSLEHPQIIKFLDKIDTPKHLYIVLEYFKGKTLSTYLKGKTGRKLSEVEAKVVFKQATEALAYCHSRNVVHRDIKLDNILINECQEIKIIDFGFSTCMPAHKKTKVLCGTPNYMAPEILAHVEFAGEAADVWALGVVLFYLLTGNYPFKGVNDRELFKRIQNGHYQVPN